MVIGERESKQTERKEKKKWMKRIAKGNQRSPLHRYYSLQFYSFVTICYDSNPFHPTRFHPSIYIEMKKAQGPYLVGYNGLE